MVSVMIQIGDKILSRELFEEQFVCNLKVCKGLCCVHGDAGAPLEEKEAEILDAHIEAIKPFMREEGQRALEENGNWMVDTDGEKVTPLVGREECAYAIFEDGIARCSIEKAYEEKKLDWQKPVSCHLYPIRVSRLSNAYALNYHRWGICEAARVLGEKEGIPVFRFLKDPLSRIYGAEFYEELENVYKEIKAFKEEENHT